MKEINLKEINNSLNTNKKIKLVEEYTKTNAKRLLALSNLVEDVIKNNIKGDFVETGVWAGGSCMMMAYTLLDNNIIKPIWMYDTYTGMSKPTDFDKKAKEENKAIEKWEESQKEDYNEWCYSSLDDVKKNMKKTKYPNQHIKYVKGKVEDTLITTKPKEIAILRLDTDFYESTLASLKHLYPLLKEGGYLIIDDFGCWEGCKKAVKEYFENKSFDYAHIDYTCIVHKKPSMNQ
jgi:Uri superfamily endonuclease